jgi:hypothetical protein
MSTTTPRTSVRHPCLQSRRIVTTVVSPAFRAVRRFETAGTDDELSRPYSADLIREGRG